MGIASARQAKDLGSNPGECLIFYLFRCVLSSLLPLQNVGRSKFDEGLHSLITLIQKRHKLMMLLDIYICMDKETLKGSKLDNVFLIWTHIFFLKVN